MRYPHRLFLPLLFCCLWAAACTPHAQTRVRLMSYNVRNGIGADGVEDLGRVSEAIVRAAPDVVALQEVDSVTRRMHGRFIPAELGRMTGMHAVFCRAIDFDGGAYGIGLLSRTEPLAVRRIPLPGREEARVLLMAEYDEYTICCTHLSLTPEDRAASLGIIREATDTCRKPVLLAGDFNIEAAAEVVEGLGGKFRLLSDTTQMTFPSDRPAQCIDYILGRGLPQSTVVEERSVDRTAAGSDHCPVRVTAAWQRRIAEK